jgi:hypothetical protein
MPKNCYLAVASVFLLIALGVPGQAAVTSPESAVLIAKDLAAALGWSYGEPTSAVLREVDLPNSRRWEVDFSEAASVNIDPDSGEILALTDFSGSNELRASTEEDRKISQEAAREVAEAALDLLGRPEGIAFEKSYQGSPHTPAWVFLWTRTFNGIPYLYDKLQIRISPLDGRVLGYGRQFISAPPPSADTKISEEDAIALARKAAATLQTAGSVSATSSAVLRVVQPNDYWGKQPNGHAWHKGAPSQVAWVVRIAQDDKEHDYQELWDNQVEYREFWVDAADGRLLGGSEAGGAGSPITPAKPAAQTGPAGVRGGAPTSLRARVLLGLRVAAAIGASFVLRASGAR